jgi:ATP diphosphatase
MTPGRDIARLLEIMAALRTPGSGCPWDLEQSFGTIAPFTVEEAYEVADAISRGDRIDLKDELGDLLLQVVFHARLAEEEGSFAFPDVVEAITTKMIRRHPHVFPSDEFGDISAMTPAEVKGLWHRIKAAEKAERRAARLAAGIAEDSSTPSALDGVPTALPALTRAWKMQAKASAVGFDWNDPVKVLDKIREETDEVDEALRSGDREHVIEEIGDLLFVIANLARHLGADPESALAAANAKFENRFRHVEQALAAEGKSPAAATLAEMEAHWQAAKCVGKPRQD